MNNFFKAAPDIRKGPHKMKRMSAKRRAVNVKRREFVAEQLAKRPVCEAGPRILAAGIVGWTPCTGIATELHEPLTRARKPGAETILDPANSVAICRACHYSLHSSPRISESIGLLVRSGG